MLVYKLGSIMEKRARMPRMAMMAWRMVEQRYEVVLKNIGNHIGPECCKTAELYWFVS